MANDNTARYIILPESALYLKKFVSDDTSWVHYDVMAWNDRAQPGRKVGGEAMGLRATYEYLNQRFG